MKLAMYMSCIAAVAMSAIRAFNAETVETVLVKGADGQPLRINKADFDADQSETGEGQYTAYHGKKDTEGLTDEQPVIGQPVTPPADVIVPPAPSAPIGLGDKAVAPASPSPGQFLIMKPGSAKGKFKVVDIAGQSVTNEGIDPAGYDTKEDAEAAIRKIAGEQNTLSQ